jgi:ABC-type dipeptide/oligopeptide/nickel transport system permease component
VTGDIGTSFRTRQPVAQDLLVRLPATLELVIAAMILGTDVRCRAGRSSPRASGTDRSRTIIATALRPRSAPPRRSSGPASLVLFIFSVQLGWLPGPGRIGTRATVAPPFVTGFYTDRRAV